MGRGGDRRMAELTGMDLKTIARGREELRRHDVTAERVRETGAGRYRMEKKRSDADIVVADGRRYCCGSVWGFEMDAKDHTDTEQRDAGQRNPGQCRMHFADAHRR